VSLTSGMKLGPYEIVGRLGQGGMGEVWRATDTRLDRQVAIKVLPAAVIADAERLARFGREAKLLAQVHHANIAAVFGLEEYGSVRALVMELVEGPTLFERLKAGALPAEECLLIARQIAEALEEAHAKGIIHRDLKPQNIKAPVDGPVKVLDFGLAKPMTSAGESPSDPAALAHSPTMTVVPTTERGIVLGTAAYMSPEQARGGTVDKRADVWAFGVVLFEMLTGRQLFAAATVSDTLAAVLRNEIDFSLLPAATPPAIRQLLRRCLERSAKNRLHDIADARIVIDEVIAGRSDDGAETSGRAAARGSRWVSAIAVTLLIIGAASVLGGVFASWRGTTPADPLRLSFSMTGAQELLTGSNAILAFSPDGTSLVFAGRMNGRRHLFRRNLNGREPTPIPGTDDGEAAFFSPDGRWIGFVSGGQIHKVASEGGRPFRVADLRGDGGCAWLHDGTIVFAPVYSDGLFRVSAEGGTVTRLTTPDKSSGELGHWWPDPLPGERYVVFTAFRTPVDQSRLGVLDLSNGQVRWVVDGGFFGRYVPTGHLVYARGQRLYAVPFDATTATVQGTAVAVLDDVLISQTSAYAMFAVSSRGMLAYVTESLGNPVRELVWLDRTGRATPAVAERQRFLSVSLSSDDRLAALTILGENRDLWMASLDRGSLSRITTGEGTEFDPVWSHDGRELFYVLDRPPFELQRIALGALDSGRPIWKEPPKLDTTSIAVSPDGLTLGFELHNEKTGRDVYTRPLDGSAPAQPVRATRSEERNLSFSPDGKWIVYQSDELGHPEIYAQPFPGPGDRIQLSSEGGNDPVWARNGEIFYLHERELRVVPARPAGRVAFDSPRVLFSYPIVHGTIHESQTFDVSRDGSRVIAVTIPDASRPRQMEIVTDWTRELERLAPRRGR
jgi:Tol biopolymer transport system component/tRNA A-37 threonylcarbamoyl transferase component Bud32